MGDSRAVASVCGRVEELSFDHKPTRESTVQLYLSEEMAFYL